MSANNTPAMSANNTLAMSANNTLAMSMSAMSSAAHSDCNAKQDCISLTINMKPRRRRGVESCHQAFEDYYTLTGSVLGSGAFSRVELCQHMTSGTLCAVKIIKKSNWYVRSRVLQEVDILSRGSGHPNIIQLLHYYEGDHQFYLVFERMAGGALIEHVQSHRSFTEGQAAKILYCVTSALQHLHNQGIAHRDLKFENLLCPDGDDFTTVKICDFDLGGQKCDAPYVSTPLMDSPVGSAEFMAPEVVSLFEGQMSVYDKSCDMWAVGVLLYIMVYGTPPFAGTCTASCGWNEGDECGRCQEVLFQRITRGDVTFDIEKPASLQVRDLITNLLRKDSKMRFTAAEVLAHPWVVFGGDNVGELCTPAQLRRTSVSNLSTAVTQINQHCRTINANTTNTTTNAGSNKADPLSYSHRCMLDR